jgi:hypothetical protein
VENAPLLEGISYPVLQIVGYIVLAGVAALVASVIPARRAARLTVIDEPPLVLDAVGVR